MSDLLTSPEWQDADFLDRQRRLREAAYAGPEGEQVEDESGPLPGSLDPSVLMANTAAFMEVEKQGQRRPDKTAQTFAERRAEAERKARDKERAEQGQRNRQLQVENRASAAMWKCWQTHSACVSWRSAVAQASSCLLPSARERIMRSCVALRLAAKSALVHSVPFASQLGLRPERICYEAECFCLHFEHGSMIGPLGAGAFDGQHHGIDTSARTPLGQWCHNRPPEPQGTQSQSQGGSDQYALAPLRGDIRQRS